MPVINLSRRFLLYDAKKGEDIVDVATAIVYSNLAGFVFNGIIVYREQNDTVKVLVEKYDKLFEPLPEYEG